MSAAWGASTSPRPAQVGLVLVGEPDGLLEPPQLLQGQRRARRVGRPVRVAEVDADVERRAHLGPLLLRRDPGEVVLRGEEG